MVGLEAGACGNQTRRIAAGKRQRGRDFMMRDSNELELAVVRTLRDSLERLQRSSDELHHAVNDIVSACSSTRPANSLSPVIRAQTAAASLAASLDVLARFITIALHPGFQSPLDQREPAMTRTSAESAPYTSTAAPAAVKPPSGPGTAPQVESAPVISDAV